MSEKKKKVNNEYAIATIIVAGLLGAGVIYLAYYFTN